MKKHVSADSSSQGLNLLVMDENGVVMLQMSWEDVESLIRERGERMTKGPAGLRRPDA